MMNHEYSRRSQKFFHRSHCTRRRKFSKKRRLQKLSCGKLKNSADKAESLSYGFEVFVLANQECHIEVKFLDKHLFYFLLCWWVKIDKMRISVTARLSQTFLPQSSTKIYTRLFITSDQTSEYADLWLIFAVIFRKKSLPHPHSK